MKASLKVSEWRYLATCIAGLTLLAVMPAVFGPATQVHAQQPMHEQIEINVQAKTTPFPHFWEEMFGSGRANLALRERYRDDLLEVKKVTSFDYVRFHGILDDDNGVYTEDQHGNPVHNFQYVDQIYDGLLKNGVRPVVEISFMPKQLAFSLLHQLGNLRLANPSKEAIVTRRQDGTLAVALWHLIDPGPGGVVQGPTRWIRLEFTGLGGEATASISRVDDQHGNSLAFYRKMGSPQYPTVKQIDELNRESALPLPEERKIVDHHLDLTLEPNALLLVTVNFAAQ